MFFQSKMEIHNMNKKTQGIQKQKSVPFIMESGTKAFVNPADISQSKWNYHHGKTAAGQEVQSLQTTEMGNSLLIRKDNSGPTLSVSQDEFEVAAVQILTAKGFSIKAPGH